ncbi:hypothetical protein AVEN_197406-1 [Araneus ventricosus]|uniref:Uncharacterized protein n=1 Tax=Araneus ventricosus TaxID=182803 RepID=A0A4Y2WB09_ARAVE|nr:hypothetical protein AVEN_197406-1 [Araneus ventricosus]
MDAFTVAPVKFNCDDGVAFSARPGTSWQFRPVPRLNERLCQGMNLPRDLPAYCEHASVIGRILADRRRFLYIRRRIDFDTPISFL